MLSKIDKIIKLILEKPIRKDITLDEYLRIMKFLGFEKVRHTGSHMIFLNKENEKTLVGVSHDKHMKASYIKELREYIIKYREDLLT